MSKQPRLLGILDWGVGGLGLLRMLQASHPGLQAVYFSDSGARPYGKLSRGELRARIALVVDTLTRRGVTHLAIACNAASTGVSGYDPGTISQLVSTPHGSLELTGVVAHALGAARRLPPSHLGVIGGQRTIRSGIYPRHLSGMGHRITQRIAQPLSAFVEAGDLGSNALRAEMERILRPVRRVDALLLACTHYPALSTRFREQLPAVQLIDPAGEMSRWISEHWAETLKPRAPGVTFLTTGDCEGFQRAGRAAFQIQISAPEAVPLFHPF